MSVGVGLVDMALEWSGRGTGKCTIRLRLVSNHYTEGNQAFLLVKDLFIYLSPTADLLRDPELAPLCGLLPEKVVTVGWTGALVCSSAVGLHISGLRSCRREQGRECMRG